MKRCSRGRRQEEKGNVDQREEEARRDVKRKGMRDKREKHTKGKTMESRDAETKQCSTRLEGNI